MSKRLEFKSPVALAATSQQNEFGAGIGGILELSRTIGEKILNTRLTVEVYKSRMRNFCEINGTTEFFENYIHNSWEGMGTVYPTLIIKTPENIFAALEPKIAYETFFSKLSEYWKSETQYLSVDEQIIEHPAYQIIIKVMKHEAVPLILKDIKAGGWDYNWDYALHEITGEDPVKKGHKTWEAINKDWLAWGEKKGLI